MKTYFDTLNPADREQVQNQYKASLDSLNEIFAELEQLFGNRDRGQLNLFVSNDLDALINPFSTTSWPVWIEPRSAPRKTWQTARSTGNTFTWLIAVLGLIGIGFSFFMGTATYRAIANPLNQMMETVQQVGQGKLHRSYRADRLPTSCPELGQAFDRVLNERVTALVEAEHETNSSTTPSSICCKRCPAQPKRPDRPCAGYRRRDWDRWRTP